MTNSCTRYQGASAPRTCWAAASIYGRIARLSRVHRTADCRGAGALESSWCVRRAAFLERVNAAATTLRGACKCDGNAQQLQMHQASGCCSDWFVHTGHFASKHWCGGTILVEQIKQLTEGASAGSCRNIAHAFRSASSVAVTGKWWWWWW